MNEVIFPIVREQSCGLALLLLCHFNSSQFVKYDLKYDLAESLGLTLYPRRVAVEI